jgi:hypothetical protein
VGASWALSNLLRLFLPTGIYSEVITLFVSILVTMIIIFVLKNTSVSEVRTLLKSAVTNTT